MYESRRLSDGEALECLAGIRLLERKGLLVPGVIKQAIQEFVDRHPEATPTLVKDFFEEWLKNKTYTTTSRETVFSAKSKIRAFINLHGDKPLVSITQQDCENFCYDHRVSKTTQGNRVGYLKDFFSYEQDMGKIGAETTSHPCYRLRKPKRIQDSEDKIPWSLEDFETLLRFSLENEDRYHATAHLLIGAYAGVRMNEMRLLRFETNGVDIERGEIYIPARIAKTKSSRIIQMHPSLRIALKRLESRSRSKPRKYCRKDALRPTDPKSAVYYPKHIKKFRSMLHLPLSEGGANLPIIDEGGLVKKDSKGVVHTTGPSAWLKNGLRSGFATYYYMLTGSAEQTAKIMGHSEGLNVFFNHYRRMAREGDGEKFFQIAEKVFNDVLG